MPPSLLFDITGIDLDKVLYDQQAIRQHNPQRGHMEHLNVISWIDPVGERIAGYKDVRADEFWVDGHIPGRPLYPGVLMIESGAQLASFYTHKVMGWTGFMGFGGLDKVKFRQEVTPGSRLYILGQKLWTRHRLILCKVQGLLKGNVVFEAEILGSKM